VEDSGVERIFREGVRNAAFSKPPYPNLPILISAIWGMHYIPNIGVCQLCFDTKRMTNVHDFLSNFVIKFNKLF
jgi:hypothetical protein